MKKIKKSFILCMFFVILLTACATPNTDTDISEGEEEVSEMLFDDPTDNTFNYCPSIMQVDENTRYVYYCANVMSGVVQDHIICRKATKEKDGKWSFTEKKVVLAPTEGKYDGLHCCDPSVVKGEFSYDGKKYEYLMAYTGNTDNVNNKVGLAVSNDPLDGWVKIENPFRTYDGDTSHWGVGQPSLISIDKKGQVMFFYAVGSTTTYTMVERIDFSDLNKPVTLSSMQLTQRGLTDLNGAVGDYLSNGDFAWDSVKKRYYCVSDCHPNPTDSEPAFVGSHFRVTYLNESGTSMGELFETSEASAGKSWSTLATIGPNDTGFPRNSNCGIVTDPYGWMLSEKEMDVFYSISETGRNYMWSYRIYPWTIEITE